MLNIDVEDDWENFLNNDINNNDDIISDINNKCREIPKCSEIYISTRTKIAYLNIKNIDIKDIFWKLEVLPYYIPQEGIIKKQIKYASNTKEEVIQIQEKLKNIDYFEEQLIEHIDNPNGRIKFKDQRKISIGICKKDLLSYRSKKKRAFFNCFVLIIRIKYNEEFREMHIKVFNTGKLEIPGIQDDKMLEHVLNILISNLNKHYKENTVTYDTNNIETVLINSNFNCGFYINREKFVEILKKKYNIKCSYDSCQYPGIQCKYNYTEKNNNYKVSFMIFRTGSVLIVGKCNKKHLITVYDFLKELFKNEYNTINQNGINIEKEKEKVKKNIKNRKKIIFRDK
jgi:TATA-box binding protein (TBP) (component of TFIID and TFIIIB)